MFNLKDLDLKLTFPEQELTKPYNLFLQKCQRVAREKYGCRGGLDSDILREKLKEF